MAFTTLPLAGSKLRAQELGDLIEELRPVTAEKSSDTSRASTTARTADPDLTLPLPANTVWEFNGVLVVSSAANAAGDFSMELTFPSGATVTLAAHGLDIGLASGAVGSINAIVPSNQDATSPTGNYDFGASTTQTGILVSGRIALGSTAGFLTVAWAQQSSNVNATVLQNGSYITARRVS